MFSALADPTRRTIYQALSQSESSTATELAAGLPVSRQAVVKHLQALAEAGLVASARQGREQRYRVTPAPLGDAMAWMLRAGARWDARLERLQRRVDASRAGH